MLVLSQPAFLVAAIAAAAVPLLLHLLARRPPPAVALPTARFVRPALRSRLRLQRRPEDWPLLLLRILFLILLGLAFSGARWEQRGEETVEIVLVDRGLAGAAADSADRVLERIARRAGEGPPPLIVPFDTMAYPGQANPVPSDQAASGTAPPEPIDYLAALLGLRAAAGGLPGSFQVRATLVTRPRWGGWRPGLGGLRREIWPGSLTLVPLPAAQNTENPASSRASSPAVAYVAAGAGRGEYVRAALGAAGWQIAPAATELPAAELYVLLPGATAAAGEGIAAAVRDGATLLLDGTATPPGGLPSPFLARRLLEAPGPAGAVYLAGGPALEGVRRTADVRLQPDARAEGAWLTGEIAVVTLVVGDGCIVGAGFGLEDPAAVISESYAPALARLAESCTATEAGTGAELAGMDAVPLGRGARAVLASPALPATVRAGDISMVGSGFELMRWLLALALLVAIADGIVARRGRNPGTAPAEGTDG